MADDLIPHNQFPKYWDPIWLKRLFEVMITGGAIGTGIGIAFDKRSVTDASLASIGAGGVGRLILTVLGY